MELWDILDEDGNPTGKLVERGKPMQQHEFHLVVHIWISNLNGLFLVSKRAECKPNGGMWETTGGSAIAGESGTEAAIREVKEELGIEIHPEKLIHLTRYKRMNPFSPDLVDAWHCIADIEISDLKPDPKEVSEVKWVDKNEIEEMIRRGKFLDVFPYLKNFFSSV